MLKCCVCGSLSGILSLLMWWWACHVSLSASAADIQKDDPHKTVNFKAVWSSLVNIWAVWLKARCCYSVCPLHGAVNPYAHCLMLDAADPLLDAVNCKSRQNYRPLFLSFWSTGPGGKQSNITRWYDLRSSYRRTTVSFVLIYVPITHTVNAYPDRSIACLHAVLISRLIIDDWCSIY